MVVRLGLNSVSVLDFPTQGLAASSLEERLCWTRLRMGVGMTDEELGSEWNNNAGLGWGQRGLGKGMVGGGGGYVQTCRVWTAVAGCPLHFDSLLGWIVTSSFLVHLAEEASPGAGEAQACRGHCRRLSRAGPCRALLR